MNSIKISKYFVSKIEYSLMKRFRFVLKCLLFISPIFLLAWRNSIAMYDETNANVIKTVCIDAGHGGKDPGCHGASANEKSVCLAIALELGKKIKEKFPNVKVIYTRDKDVFVELDERAKIANRNKADLFICIHANAASPSAFGSETYVLGLHKTDAQAKIADRENATINYEEDKGAKYKTIDMSSDAMILRQLQLSVFLDQSIKFAEKVQGEFKTLGRSDRGVRQAGFLVLWQTTMPSVLIETGFLTNIEEEKFLAATDNQKKMADAIFKAFEKYKTELEGKGTSTVANDSTINSNQDSISNLAISKVIQFKVQIATSPTKISLKSTKFKGVVVEEYQQEKTFKYTAGNFENNFKEANNYKNEMRKLGFSEAFIVAFQNGERVNLEKAIKLAEN